MSIAEKLGSNLGPIGAENRVFGANKTHYRPKRINKLANQLLVRDQGVGGSNPLSPTIYFHILATDAEHSKVEPPILAQGVDRKNPHKH